jgi:hypothetical protein
MVVWGKRLQVGAKQKLQEGAKQGGVEKELWTCRCTSEWPCAIEACVGGWEKREACGS